MGIFQNIPKTEIERWEKRIVKVFKNCGLPITVKCNLKSVDFLNVIVNDIYKPYRKPSNRPLYITKHSNHPSNILEQLPKSIEKRITETSLNTDVFNRSIKIYNDALHESNFKETLQFLINNYKNQKRKRKWNIIWFNPPYSKNVKTNIGKTFLQLLSKHFPEDHQMHKIFNKNTLKVSYSCSCMNNVSSILSTHNKNILNPKQTSFGCNCRNKDNCECLTPNIIRCADIITDNDHKFYYGTSETTFKKRHSNRTWDFKHVKYKHAAEFAKYIEQFKNNNFNYSVKWLIASKLYGNSLS